MDAKLTIAVQPSWLEYTTKCVIDGFERRESCKLPGSAKEIFDFMAKYAKLPYRIVETPPELQVGQVIDRKNMMWDGILGEIQKGHYDTIADLFSHNGDRDATFGFTIPLTSTQFTYVVGPSEPDFLTSAFRLFTIFKPTLMALMIGSLLIVLCGILLTQVLDIKSENLDADEKRRKLNRLDRLIVSLKLNQGRERIRRSFTEKTLLLLFCAALLLFTGLYESCLLSFLLIPSTVAHMSESHILDLVYKGQLSFLIEEEDYKTSGTWQLIRYSKEEQFQKFQAALKQNPPLLFRGINEAIEIFRLYPSKYVHVGFKETTDALTQSDCKLRKIQMVDPLEFRLGFLFLKNSTRLLRKFDESINRNLAFVRSVSEYYSKQGRTTCPSVVTLKKMVKPLGLVTLFSGFTLLFIGFISAFGSFLFEIIFNRKPRKLLKEDSIKWKKLLRRKRLKDSEA